jgi:hypothetical protein
MEKKKRFRRAFVSTYVYTTIRQGIEGGRFQVETILPSEKELGEECGVSRMTIRGVLKRLAVDGFIKSVPGKGWLVVSQSITHHFSHLNPVLLMGSPFYSESIFLNVLIKQLNDIGLNATAGLPMKNIDNYFPSNSPCPWSAVIVYSGSSLNPELVSACNKANIPLIGAMVCEPQDEYDTMVNDHELEIKELLAKMIQEGCKNIAYLSAKDLENSNDVSFKMQRKAFGEFMKPYNKSPQQFLCKYNYALDEAEAVRFLNWLNPSATNIDALYCTSANMVELAMHNLSRVGKSASKDIQVCGARIKVHPAQLKQHGLSHLWGVDADHEALVSSIVQTLSQRLRGDKSLPQHHVLPSRIYRITGVSGPSL